MSFDIAGSGVTEHLKEPELRTLQIKCHFGLGDAFVMQGMVHHYVLSSKYRKIIFNTRRVYGGEINRLYRHIRSMIDVQFHNDYDVEPPDHPEADEIVKLGFFSGDKTFHVQTWDREFYRQAGIPFINRWLHCYVPRPSREVKRRDFVIRHHDPKRGFLIEGMKPDMDIIGSDEKPMVLDWVPELMAAKEIHVIDSCVMNLVESMWHLQMVRPDAKLCYHAYARKDPPATVLAPWKVIK